MGLIKWFNRKMAELGDRIDGLLGLALVGLAVYMYSAWGIAQTYVIAAAVHYAFEVTADWSIWPGKKMLRRISDLLSSVLHAGALPVVGYYGVQFYNDYDTNGNFNTMLADNAVMTNTILAGSLIVEQFFDPMEYSNFLITVLWGGAAGYIFAMGDGATDQIVGGMQLSAATVYL